jgi:transketolase
MTTLELKNKAKEIRKSIIESIAEAGSGHTGGSLGLADIFTALYFDILNHKAQDPKWEDRDRLILSIGHVAPVLYASLAHAEYFPIELLKSLRKLGSPLQGHPSIEHKLEGIELAAGSLGQGLSVSVGLALSAKIDKKDFYTYCIMGDGELQEGSVWEAGMSASHHKLDNLIAIVDRNYVQIDGKTSDVMELEPLDKKWEAFGWEVFSCDGNNIQEFIETVDSAKNKNQKPKIIIAKTKMGKGIPEIEDNYTWHGKAPNREELKRFLAELS